MENKKNKLTGRKQTKEQIRKRVEATKRTKEKWSEERRQEWKDKISKNNGQRSDEARRRNSEAHKGQIAWNKGLTAIDDERVAVGNKHGMFGKKHTKESILKISSAKTGIKQTPEVIEKRIASLRGRPRPKEVKDRIKATNIKTWSNPDIRNKVTGENSPAWLGGKSFEKYPREFSPNLKESIRERDKLVCQICGDRGKEKLCVHHIDYDKKNCSPSNLISLCRSCHSKTNYERESWSEELIAKTQVVQN